MTVVYKKVDFCRDCQCRIFLKSQGKCRVPNGCPLPASYRELIVKGFLHHVLQEVVQGLQHMTICWISCWSFDLRKDSIPRWFPSTESLPEPVSVISVVGRLMN